MAGGPDRSPLLTVYSDRRPAIDWASGLPRPDRTVGRAPGRGAVVPPLTIPQHGQQGRQYVRLSAGAAKRGIGLLTDVSVESAGW